jgi:hypothetical protein
MPSPAATRSSASAAPERLPFSLPDFTRISWASERARGVWEPRIQRITKAWLEIEWRAVADGARTCAVRPMWLPDLVTEAPDWADAGLGSLPLVLEGAGDSEYSAVSERLRVDGPFRIRVVIGGVRELAAFKRAWDDADQEAIGSMLGYPTCCREFFHDVWVQHGMVDPTWPMAAATASADQHAHVLEIEGPPEGNILWRWMGVRAVPHLPCRADCAASTELGRRMLAIGRQSGLEEEVEWMLEILSWPLEWSALHGIAEVRTPVLKVTTMTDATPSKYVVRRLGTRFPREGARGLEFPYRASRRALSSSRAFERGLAKARENAGE